MSPRQILARLYVRSKRKLIAVSGLGGLIYRPPKRLEGNLKPAENLLLPSLGTIHQGPVNSALNSKIKLAGKHLREHQFSFVGETSTFEGDVDWYEPSHSRLWRLNLHYFDNAPLWILDSIRNDETSNLDLFTQLVTSWINSNPVGVFEAWNPYCLSRRIPNWIFAYQIAHSAGIIDSAFSNLLLSSLFVQTKYLYSNVEWDLPMNHLTANGRALFIAGAFFGGAYGESWLNRGKKLVLDRLVQDVCSDGGHAERSPMYHSLVLQDSLECLAISRWKNLPWPERAINTLRKMTDFLESIEHPDGDIPLFNDSALGIAIPSRCIVMAARHVLSEQDPTTHGPEKGSITPLSAIFNFPEHKVDSQESTRTSNLIAFPETGYFVLTTHDREMKMVFDCGEVGIQKVAGHSHSDFLSYELSYRDQRFIVDTGTSTYASGPRRYFERSIFAHNTITVNGMDTCEPWGDYRLGRRGHPGKVQTLKKRGFALVDAGHSSFLASKNISHRRAVISVGHHFIIFDRIFAPANSWAESFVHFHPDFELSFTAQQKTRIHASGPKAKNVGINIFGGNVVEARSSDDQHSRLYSPRFGETVLTNFLTIQLQGKQLQSSGYVISPEESLVEIQRTDSGWQIVLAFKNQQIEALLSASGLTVKGDYSITHAWI